MSVIVHYAGLPQTPVVVDFNGDSISSPGFNWQGYPGGLIDQVNAAVLAGVGGNLIAGTGRNIGTTAPVVTGRTGSNATFSTPPTITPITTAVSNNTITDLLNTVTARVTAKSPSILVTMVGVNDMVGNTNGTSPQTTPSGFRAVYDQYLDAVIAANPTTQLLCLSIWTFNEKWSSGPPLAWANPSGHDADIPLFNAQIKASIEARGGTYVDIYTPLLTLESTHNTPEPGVASGVYTIDGIHPSAPLGKLAIGSAAITGFVVAA